MHCLGTSAMLKNKGYCRQRKQYYLRGQFDGPQLHEREIFMPQAGLCFAVVVLWLLN